MYFKKVKYFLINYDIILTNLAENFTRLYFFLFYGSC